HYRRRTASSIC
ncbi:his Kinase A domain protein, partial [Vibrio parahaemolyticus V-223/04]